MGYEPPDVDGSRSQLSAERTRRAVVAVAAEDLLPESEINHPHHHVGRGRIIASSPLKESLDRPVAPTNLHAPGAVVVPQSRRPMRHRLRISCSR